MQRQWIVLRWQRKQLYAANSVFTWYAVHRTTVPVCMSQTDVSWRLFNCRLHRTDACANTGASSGMQQYLRTGWRRNQSVLYVGHVSTHHRLVVVAACLLNWRGWFNAADMQFQCNVCRSRRSMPVRRMFVRQSGNWSGCTLRRTNTGADARSDPAANAVADTSVQSCLPVNTRQYVPLRRHVRCHTRRFHAYLPVERIATQHESRQQLWHMLECRFAVRMHTVLLPTLNYHHCAGVHPRYSGAHASADVRCVL